MNNGVIFINCEQGSEQWHMARAGVITASIFGESISKTGGLTDQQAAYVAAVQRGCTEGQAMLEAGYKAKPKADGITRALAGLPIGEPSGASNKHAARVAIEQISKKPYGDIDREFFATERGHKEEFFARTIYETRFKVIVDEAGLALTSDRLFGYSTDGFVGTDGLIEVKCPLDLLKVLNIIQTGDVSEYIHQIQGGMWITGRKWCDFLMPVPDLAALNNGNELYVKRIYRDDDFIDAMVEELWQFAGRVKRFKTILSEPFNKAANDEQAAAAA